MLNYAKLCVFVALNGNTCSSDLPDAAVPLPQHLHTAPSLACCLWAVPVLLVPYSTFVRVRKGKGALVCGDPSSLERQNKILGACQQVTSLFWDKICFLPYCRNTSGFCLVKFWIFFPAAFAGCINTLPLGVFSLISNGVFQLEE